MSRVRHLSYLGVTLAAVVMAAGCSDGVVGPSRGYKLSGVVLNATLSGRMPIVGAEVKNLANQYTTYTDTQGRYELFGLADGTTMVQISAWRFNTASQNVTLSGDSVVDFELRAREQFVLSGFVTEATTAGPLPVKGVTVQLLQCPPMPRGVYQTAEAETDANGFYRVEGMCDGVTTLFVLNPGFDLEPGPRPTCDLEFQTCRWVTIAGDTRFDFQVTRK